MAKELPRRDSFFVGGDDAPTVTFHSATIAALKAAAASPHNENRTAPGPSPPVSLDGISLSVPFAILFFSSEGVVVQYCLRVATAQGASQISKRFSDVVQLDEAVNDSRWWTTIIKSSSRLALPKLTTATVGKTNNSLKAVTKRRLELNAYFESLSKLLQGNRQRRAVIAKQLVPFLACDATGPTALLPESYRAAAAGDHLVFAFFRVPPDFASPAPAANGGDALQKERADHSDNDPMSRPRTPETRARTPEMRPKTPTEPPRLKGASQQMAASGECAQSASTDEELGLLPRVTVALPRSIMYLDESDHLTVSLTCEKSDKRQDTAARFRELLAFYRFIATTGDRIPTPEEARAFFLDRQGLPSRNRKASTARKNASRLRAADAASTPSPFSGAEPALSLASDDARRSLLGGSPVRTSLLVEGVNPIAGVTATLPKGRGDAFALRVGVLRSARETGNSMHLVANSTGAASDFAPCMHCSCTERALCNSAPDASARTSRYVMACDRWLDVSPPQSANSSTNVSFAEHRRVAEPEPK
jgi:hypothetical protein